MNHVFRLVWSPKSQALIAVAESSSTRGKRSSSCISGMLLASVLLVSPCVTGAAGAAPVLPSGEVVKSGVVHIKRPDASNVRILQPSGPAGSVARAAIDWKSFSIGKGGRVEFVQPGSNSVILNRVVGHEKSIIDGSLKANGKVFLLNSSGILFSESARVDVGSLLASTAQISDKDFEAGIYRLTGQTDSAGSGVRNQGEIEARDGGFIGLLGKVVENEGEISASLGRVVLASGEHFTLTPEGSYFGVAIDAGTANALVKNSGEIDADGGSVLLSAKGLQKALTGAVNHTGHISARTIEEHKGLIRLQSDNVAKVDVSGTVDVSVKEGSAAKGGEVFIDASTAGQVVIDEKTVVNLAPQGSLKLEGRAVAIGSPEDAGTSNTRPQMRVALPTLERALESGDVSINAADGAGGPADIQVNEPLSWSATKLELRASGNILVNDVVTVNDKATLDLHAGYKSKLGVIGWAVEKISGVDNDHSVQMKIRVDGVSGASSFKGRIDFPGRSGDEALSINGQKYTLISNIGAVEEIGSTGLAKAYALSGDIDASAADAMVEPKPFDPVGTTKTPFIGVFEGLGHSIKHIEIKDANDNNPVGVFRVTDGALIRNLRLEAISVTGREEVGALAGRMSGGKISNVLVSGAVKGVAVVGGLVGKGLEAVVESSHFLGTVTGDCGSSIPGWSDESGEKWALVGGLVGQLGVGESTSGIRNSSFLGIVNASGGAVGGAIGLLEEQGRRFSSWRQSIKAIEHVNVVGRVEVSDPGGRPSLRAGIGGIVGGADGNFMIKSANFQGVVEARHARGVGGIAGIMRGGQIVEGAVGAYSEIGASVTGYSGVGGLVGKMINVSLSNSRFERGAVKGVSSTGGLFGVMDGGTAKKSWVDGTVIARNIGSEGNEFGGLGGRVEAGAHINECSSAAVVEAPNAKTVGGAVGYLNRSDVQGVNIGGCGASWCADFEKLAHNDNARAPIRVLGATEVGLLAGRTELGSLKNCVVSPALEATSSELPGASVDWIGNKVKGKNWDDFRHFFAGETQVNDVRFANLKPALPVDHGRNVDGFVGTGEVGDLPQPVLVSSRYEEPEPADSAAPMMSDMALIPVATADAPQGASSNASAKMIVNDIAEAEPPGPSGANETPLLSAIADHEGVSLIPRGLLSSADFMQGRYDEAGHAEVMVLQRDVPMDDLFGGDAPLSIVSETNEEEPVTIDQTRRMVALPGSSVTDPVSLLDSRNNTSSPEANTDAPQGASSNASAKMIVNDIAEAEPTGLSGANETPLLSAIADHEGVSLIPRGLLSSADFMQGRYDEAGHAEAMVLQRNVSTDDRFGGDAPLSIVSETDEDEPDEPVTIDQVRRMVTLPSANAAGPVRLPVSRTNTLMGTMDGGVALPPGVRQFMFVIKTR